MILTLDFEAYSEVSIRDVGSYAYVRHPSTRVLCLAYALDDHPPGLWTPSMRAPQDLLQLAANPEVLFEAHKADMERGMWEEVCIPQHGFPPIAPERWRCSLAACAYRALPLKLEHAAKVLHLPEQKDMAGNAAMKYLARPALVQCPACRAFTGKGALQVQPGCWECDGAGKVRVRRHDPARLVACADYCRQDLRTERGISGRIGGLPPEELRVWQLDQEINRRGVRIDTELCRKAIEIAGQYERRMVAEFEGLTGGLQPTQVAQVLDWCSKQGARLPDMRADTVAMWLGGQGLSENVRRALEIRALTAKASVKKYQTALDCLCPDGRARGMLQYHGAGTGRWAGRLIQLQNMVRPKLDIDMDDLCHLIKEGDLEALEMITGDPMQALSDASRGMVIPADGHVLAGFDFSSVEAVVLACMAGEEWKIEAFRNKEDVYCLFAQDIYGFLPNKKDHPLERQTGKTGELAFGYMGGYNAWLKFDDSGRHSPEDIDGYKKAWRRKHPRVKAMWGDLGDACLAAVLNPGTTTSANGFEYHCDDGFLSCRLLSGRKIWYPNPTVEMTEMPWTDDEGDPVVRPQVHYDTVQNGQMVRGRAWPGLLTENIDQALSRDLMVAAMLRCEAAGFPLILTVHDELIAEVPEGDADRARELIPQLMAEPTPWSQGWPIRAEGGTMERYRK